MNQKSEYHHDNINAHHLGLYIKEARLRRKYRLAETASGICSISILSRIESGILEPSPIIFEKLAKKLELKFPDCKWRNPISSLKAMIYRDDLDEVDSLLNSDCLYDYERPFLAFLVAVKKDDIKKAEKFKNIIDRWAEHLNPMEAQIYKLFNAMYFFSKYEWEEGANYLELSYKIAQQHAIHDPLLDMEIAKYYFTISCTHLGFVFLEKAYCLFQKVLVKKSLIECLIMWCDEYIKLGELSAATDKLEQLQHFLELEQNEILENDILSLAGRIASLRQELDVAQSIFLKLANKNKHNLSELCLMSIIEFYDVRGATDRISDLMNKLDMKQMSQQMQIALEYYYYKITATFCNDYERFLLDDAIPQSMLALNVARVTMYMKVLIQLYELRRSYRRIAKTYQELEAFRDKLCKMKIFS